MFLYELPTTGAISFSEFCIDQSTDKRQLLHLPIATQARANIRVALKDSKRYGQKDFLHLVKLLEDYVPQLRGIISCVAEDEIGLKSEPSFSWRTTLSANIFNSSPRISLPGLYADLTFTLVTYAFALSNLGRSTAISLGQYERDRAISESERKVKDRQLNVAVDFLCRASGIFVYISDTVLPEWEAKIKGGVTSLEKPPELDRETNSALAKMALADAQSLAIRALLSKAAYDNNIAPGPPLPRSHPSPTLIAKLHLESSSLYTSALSLVNATGPRRHLSYASGSKGEVSAELRRYLADEGVFHAGLARKWLGVDAGEKGGEKRGGEAVGFLAWAKKELERLKDSGKGINITRDNKEIRDRLKERIADELESVNMFFKYYKKANDSIHFQPVPTQAELQARIPTGMMVVNTKPYSPLPPAFGPGSLMHLEKQVDTLGISGKTETEKYTHNETSPATASTYAGVGSYF